MISDDARRLLALCAIRVGGSSVDWNLIARESLSANGLDRLYRGVVVEQSRVADNARVLLPQGLADLTAAYDRVDHEVALARGVGARLVTVLDDDYPANLRLIHNLPPFLFIRGEVLPTDVRSVAVVGTRDATERGIVRARKMSRRLVQQGVTVVSGLAAGIDAAAHTEALERGGRTLAVLGTGITKCYPKDKAELAERIAAAGALVSQFWPSTPPTTWTFPRRNVVTSGISQGTVVIEATSTSGAKMQARLALDHGKRVWLIKSLVTDQPWADKYVRTRGAREVASVDEVVDDLLDADTLWSNAERMRQLTLDVL